MKSWHITQGGIDYGHFHGETAQEAVENMHREACDPEEIHMDEWEVEES